MACGGGCSGSERGEPSVPTGVGSDGCGGPGYIGGGAIAPAPYAAVGSTRERQLWLTDVRVHVLVFFCVLLRFLTDFLYGE